MEIAIIVMMNYNSTYMKSSSSLVLENPIKEDTHLYLQGNLYFGLLVLHAGGNGHDGVDELHHARVAAVAVATGHHLRLRQQSLTVSG